MRSNVQYPLGGITAPVISPRGFSLRRLLFSASEPGVIFDPTDITTLYQDRAGTTPVTAAGQSVGLRLDKSKGLALGPELVTNGTFDVNINGWSSTGSSTSAWESGAARWSTAIAEFSGIRSASFTTVVGKTYEITATVLENTGAAWRIIFVNGDGSYSNGTENYTNPSTKIARFVATQATSFVEIRNGTAATASRLIDNISVRELPGTHEVAINDASRGIYGWMPKTGRRNLLTYTEQFDNAAWTKPFSGTGVVAIVTQNYGMAPDETATACRLQLNKGAGATAGDYSGFQQTYSIASQSTGSIYIKTADGTTKSVTLRTNTTTTSVSVTAEWQRVSVTEVSSSFLQIILRGTYGTSDSADLLIWHPQLELGSTATAYQRAVSNYDITEAGVPSCYYVLANGVNTAYVTPTITPGTDKVQVFAGVRIDLVNSSGTFIETSAAADGNNGAFFLRQRVAGIHQFQWTFRSTTNASSIFAYAVPETSVLTATSDFSAPLTTTRRNGVQKTTIAAPAAGTTNFLAYPAYIYARGGTTLPFNGYDFGHVVRFGPNLDAATIARVEALIARNTPEVTL